MRYGAGGVPTSQASQLAALTALRARHGQRGWLANFGADAVSVMTGLPDAAVGSVKQAIAGPVLLYSFTGLGGSKGARQFGNRQLNKFADESIAQAKFTYNNWLPLFQGDLDKFGQNLRNDSFFMASDVAGVLPIGGAASRVTGRVAGRVAAKVGAESASSWLLRHTDKSPGAAIRQGKTRTYSARGESGDVVDVRTRQMGLLSKNPYTRALQRIRRAASEQAIQSVAARSAAGGKYARRAETALYTRQVKREAKDVKRLLTSEPANQGAILTRELQRDLRKLRKTQVGTGISTKSARYEELAVALHLKGLLQHPDSSLTPGQVRDDLVAYLDHGADIADGMGQQTKRRRAQTDAIRSIPESMLDLATAPERVRAAVESGRKLGLQVTNFRLDRMDAARRIAAEQSYQDAGYRHAAMAYTGREWDPNAPGQELSAAMAERDAARAKLSDLMRRRDQDPDNPGRTVPLQGVRDARSALDDAVAADRVSLEAKRAAARNDVKVAQRALTVAKRSKDRAAVAEAERALALARARVAPGRAGAAAAPSVSDADRILRVLRSRADRAEGRNVDNIALIRRLERALGREQGKRVGSHYEIVQAARDLEAAQTRVRRLSGRKASHGAWSSTGRAWDGQIPAVHMTDRPLDPIAKKNGEPWTAATDNPMYRAHTSLAPDKTYRSTGTIFRTANALMDPAAAVVSAHEAVASAFRADFVVRFTETAALRGHDGKPLFGVDAANVALENPDAVVLISTRNLQRSIAEQASVADSGLGIFDQDLLGAGAFQKLDALDPNLAAELDKHPDDYIAVSKQFYNQAVKLATDPRTDAGKLFDRGLHAWRSGMLAYAPRWYVNNLIGNMFMFGMLAGADVRSIRQAVSSIRSPERFSDRFVSEATREQRRTRRQQKADALTDRIPLDFRDAGLLGEVAADMKARKLPGEAMTARERVSEFTQGLFEFNSKLEQVWRRAAWINQAKAQGRDAGVRRALRGSTADERLIIAIDGMSDASKEEALKTAGRFIGIYGDMSEFERRFVRRAIPFYSWLRVIGRLTFSMPFTNPTRLWALIQLQQIQSTIENPDDWYRDSYDRGAINLWGGKIVRTASSNPLQTWAGAVEALAAGDSGRAVHEIASSTNPLVQGIAAKAFGIDPFTRREFTAPTWESSGGQEYGRNTQEIDPVTGRPKDARPTPSLFDLVVRSTPVLNMVRPALSDREGLAPWGTTSTIDLIRYALDRQNPEGVFMPPSATRPVVRHSYTAPTGWFGFPVVTRDVAAEIARIAKENENIDKGTQQAARTREKNAAKIQAYYQSRFGDR